jgi:hypothetical protein
LSSHASTRLRRVSFCIHLGCPYCWLSLWPKGIDVAALVQRQVLTQPLWCKTVLITPRWIGVCLYAQFTAKSAARRISHWMWRMPTCVGYVLLGVGGLLWLLGII